MMKNYTLTLFLIVVFCLQVSAQKNNNNYTTAIGVKIYPGSISAKHFIKENKAIEGLASFWEDGTRFTALYEIHHEIKSIDALKWYVGYGAHIGNWSNTWKINNPTKSFNTAIGIDGVLGLDYTIKNAPLNISLDWQPSFNLIGYQYFESGWGGLGIRYTL